MSLDVRKILGSVTQALVERGLENETLRFLEAKTPDDIYLCIKSNQNIIGEIDPKVKQRLANLASKTPDWFNQVISEPYILNILKQKRPELYAIIRSTPNGSEWLRSQISGFREALLT